MDKQADHIEPVNSVDAVEPLEDVLDADGFLPVTYHTEYDQMTVKELQSLARSKGLSVSSGMKKAGLIEALKAADVTASSSAVHENQAQGSDDE